MTQKEFILEQLASTSNQKSWFVPLSGALSGLSAENAARKDAAGSHTVWEIVTHLVFWNGRWLVRLKSGTPSEMESENSGTFMNGTADEAAWSEIRQKLFSTLEQIEESVKAATEEDLQKEAFPGYGAAWLDVFCQMAIHNAYHTGQIVLLRKQQGSWDASEGVS